MQPWLFPRSSSTARTRRQVTTNEKPLLYTRSEDTGRRPAPAPRPLEPVSSLPVATGVIGHSPQDRDRRGELTADTTLANGAGPPGAAGGCGSIRLGRHWRLFLFLVLLNPRDAPWPKQMVEGTLERKRTVVLQGGLCSRQPDAEQQPFVRSLLVPESSRSHSVEHSGQRLLLRADCTPGPGAAPACSWPAVWGTGTEPGSSQAPSRTSCHPPCRDTLTVHWHLGS